jgi:hypothetical protein
MLIIEDINKYVEKNSTNWPDARSLIQYLRGTFDRWQTFAPVLDKDLNKLKSAYFEAKKPINTHIKKLEQTVVNAKESLIAKVEAISGDDNDINIKQFNDLKNDWKKAGSAGRKLDNKLWDKFNKSADRFFNAKKEVIDEEIKLANDLISKLSKDEISITEASNEIQNLTNVSKTKELASLRSAIKDKKILQENKTKSIKLKSYKNLLDAFENDNYDDKDLPNSIVSKISEFKLSKSNSENLQYVCIKLELMAGIESLKKDKDVRQTIQLEMLTTKFNKSSNNLSSLDDLLVYFFENLSNKGITASEKTLWKRISACTEKLLS